MVWFLISHSPASPSNSAVVKGFWMYNDQKLIENQLSDGVEVFVAAFVLILLCNLTAVLVLNTTWILWRVYVVIPWGVNVCCLKCPDSDSRLLCDMNLKYFFCLQNFPLLWKYNALITKKQNHLVFISNCHSSIFIKLVYLWIDFC